MTKATARHILVDTEEQCQSLKDEIDGGADFADLAGGAGQRNACSKSPLGRMKPSLVVDHSRGSATLRKGSQLTGGYGTRGRLEQTKL